MLRVDELTAARRAVTRWRTVAILSWVAVLGVGGWLVYAQHEAHKHDRSEYCNATYDIGSPEWFACD